MESIVTALITGGMALLGVIITNFSNGRKVQSALEKHQAVTDTKLEELTREVRAHNHFAQRIPVLEEKVHNLERRLN